MQGDAARRAQRALAPLKPREREVVRLRFGTGTDHEHTLAEIAERFDVSRERIRQIEAQALARLRRSEGRTLAS